MKTKYWYWLWKTFLGPSRLRKKFVRVFILAGLIPLVLMGIVSVYLVSLTHRIDVTALEANVARQAATEIKKLIDENRAALELTVTFEEFAPLAFVQQEFLLESILKENPALSEVSMICLTPVFCTVGEATASWQRTLDGLKPVKQDKNASREQFFIDAKAGKNYFGPIEFLESGPAALGAAPMFNKKGEIISILKAVINLSELQDIVANTRLGETGYAYLTDTEGAIIAYPDGEFIGTDASAVPPIKSALNSKLEESKSQSYQSFKNKSVSGTAAVIEELNWLVVAEWPTAETQELIQTIFLQFAGFSALTLLIIAIIATWMALKLIEPIAQLRQSTSVIGGGNFNYRVSIKTGDELEDLGANLNKMAENLKGLEELHELKLRTELLSESLKKEQELSKLKDQFITTVSHQFNTPLSVINWALDGLNDPAVKSKKVKESAQIISQSQKDIAAIVSDLTTLSEIGFRYKKDKDQPADLAVLTNKTIDALKNSLKVKNITLNFKKSAVDPVAKVNEFTMNKAIGNLIDNAIAYSHEGGAVEVELAGSDKELTLKVSDHGIGIPEADKPLIFQQFFRAKNAVAKKNAGTGLGLFIAKTIIEGHGGRITFTSEENKGTTFVATIPRS